MLQHLLLEPGDFAWNILRGLRHENVPRQPDDEEATCFGDQISHVTDVYHDPVSLRSRRYCPPPRPTGVCGSRESRSRSGSFLTPLCTSKIMVGFEPGS